MRKLSIAYRIYPGVSKIPAIFKDDKFKLSELCLKSFCFALENVDYKVWAILDNCPNEYEKLFSDNIPVERLEIIKLPPTGNAGTFGIQLDILSKQNFSENVYFAEDDYFYLPGTFSEMLEFMSSSNADFVSPYDHPDYYTCELHKYSFETIRHSDRNWRTAGSTCMTFLTSKPTMQLTKKVLESYTKKNDDASLWFSLTKRNIFNPVSMLRNMRDRNRLKLFIKSWLHSPEYNIFGKKMKLWTPVPSLATHLDSLHLAMNIDWQTEFQKFI